MIINSGPTGDTIRRALPLWVDASRHGGVQVWQMNDE